MANEAEWYIQEVKKPKADPGRWLKDCKERYEYIARYVDGILIFSKEPEELIKRLQSAYPLQGVGVPEYFGGDFKAHKGHGEIETFTFCAKTYLSKVCEKIEKLVDIWLMGFESPLATGDHPKADDC